MSPLMWETELIWHFMDVAYSCTDGKKAIEPTGEQRLREAARVHATSHATRIMSFQG